MLLACRKASKAQNRDAINATACCRLLSKLDSAPDMLNWTAVEDREVQRCHEPVVRHTRTETVMLKVKPQPSHIISKKRFVITDL
jgi:hypothetical protein